MLKIGVLGSADLLQNQIQTILALSERFHLVGIFDEQLEGKSKKVSGVKVFESMDELIQAVDCVYLSSNATLHYANRIIRSSKHIFLESFVADSMDKAKSIVNLSHEAGIVAQIGHNMRYSSVIEGVKEKIKPAKFIDFSYNRKSSANLNSAVAWTARLTESIDLILNTVNSNVRTLQASGVIVAGEGIDFINARIEFDNGCVANLSFNLLFDEDAKNVQIFGNEKLVKLDLLKNKAEICTINHNELANQKKVVKTDLLEDSESPMKNSFISFSDCILNQSETKVTMDHGFQAYAIAQQVMEKVENRLAAPSKQ
jgi:predicted dehydrogenase